MLAGGDDISVAAIVDVAAARPFVCGFSEGHTNLHFERKCFLEGGRSPLQNP